MKSAFSHIIPKVLWFLTLLVFQGSPMTCVGAQAQANVDSLVSKINRFFERGAYREALPILEEALRLTSDSSKRRKILADLGYAHYHVGHFDQSIGYYTQAAEIAMQSRDTLRTARYIRSKGLNFQRLGLYAIALDSYKEALLLVKGKSGYMALEADIYNSMGLLYQQLNDLSDGMEMLRKAEVIYKSQNDSTGLAKIWTNVAICWDDLAHYDSALYYNRLALDIKRRHNDPMELASTINNIAVNLLNLGQVDEAYPYLLESYRLHLKINDPEGIAIGQKNLADYALRKGLLSQSDAYLDSAIVLLETLRSQDYLIEALELQIRLRERMGDFERALNTYKRYDSLKAALFLEEKFNVQEIGNLYLLREKEFENEQVQTRATLLEIKNSQFKLTILLLGTIGIMTMTFGLITKRNLRVQKIQSEHIRRQNEVIRAQQDDLRHRTSNSLSRSQGIINTIARKIDDPDVKMNLRRATQILLTASEMERHLIGLDDEKTVDMGLFIEGMIGHQRKALQLEHRNVQIAFQHDPHIELPVNQVINTSIILNEWITNSIKYAFVNRQDGNIYIQITERNNVITLNYRDDGTGYSPLDAKGTGSKLNELFMKELNATYTTSHEDGTQHLLHFSIHPTKHHKPTLL
ncbi:MAG: tetratricopeptide repeat protein [Lunatimonas sp.]|uniref:tetratricopeptide repeat protein n=1 Tax=Lunatimonas sp. TaxID=2060141 RepID=UPI00263BD076|nr:tetratricopeptide repeat protein [Lunatimonas sp.]MCC5939126.1 tetratricopeptide repeat protein [Lunatimonas sp.]